MSKINRGSGVLVVLRGSRRKGSVREGRVQVRGGVRWPHTLPSRVRGARAAASFSGFVLLLTRGASGGIRPGILAHQPSRGCGPRRSTLPSWTHEDTSVHARGRDRSLEERRARHINSGGDEALFGSGAPHHTPPDPAVSAPLLSHTPTHSRREPGEGRRLRDGEMLIIRGRQPTRHSTYTYKVNKYVKICVFLPRLI